MNDDPSFKEWKSLGFELLSIKKEREYRLKNNKKLNTEDLFKCEKEILKQLQLLKPRLLDTTRSNI